MTVFEKELRMKGHWPMRGNGASGSSQLPQGELGNSPVVSAPVGELGAEIAAVAARLPDGFWKGMKLDD